MVARLRALGLPGVTARTFHAHALSMLRHFWPSRHDGQPLPDLLDSKLPILIRLVRQLPGHYRFTPSKDIADEIEWAKARRIGPGGYEAAGRAAGREPPIPVDLFVRTFENYERAKARAGRIDFDDLLVETVSMLETDEDAAATVRSRKRWFSVDEYQDTNPLQQRLLELWLGESRDLCVVGDEDQTIYTFTGASSTFLTDVHRALARAQEVALVRNYRSTPQVLALANRLLAAEGRTKRLEATRGDGPEPEITKHPSADAELDWLTGAIRARLGEGIAPAEIAVLVRMNAQLAPIEEALTRAGVAYVVRGLRFYDRPEVRAAVESLRRRPALDATGVRLHDAIKERWADAVGFEEDGAAEGDEARERQASLETLLAIVAGRRPADANADVGTVLAELDARAAHEKAGVGGRRQPAHVPPGEGARVGRRVPPGARGGEPADPPGHRRRRGARRGAPAALRGPHPGADAPRALVGGAPRDPRPRDATPAEPLPADLRPRPAPGARSASCPDRGSRVPARSPPAPAPPTTTTRCSRRCASGGRASPGTRRCRPTSSPTTRRSRPSPRPDRGRSPRYAG